ncbi:MAG: peroxiredoxin [Myxococcota bacterium]|jgi:peroxiredoxin (alkyl hydroperoxide reductase subunit C)|nr:peroxiredoxin [Myxococcota bacterium]
MNATRDVCENTGLVRLGQKAPSFEAVTTHGTLKLEDFAGSWLVLFSHPADFTPVCTTEFIAFSEIHETLRAQGCELLGLSIDSVYSHIAWVRSIEEKMGVKIGFPVIADLDRAVATAFGMIMPGESKTESSRCVFVIDPQSIIRAMIYYPMSLGRSTDEIVRIVTALQTADEHKVATPANWKPGAEVILPAPSTAEAAQERLKTGGPGCRDWYFCKKKL